MGDMISGVTDAIGLTDSSNAGDQARLASQQNLAFQQKGLDYMMEREAIPQQFREGALTQLGGLYGLEGGEGNQQALIDQAMQSPLYGAIMGGQAAGEDAILRNASMTGGMRSGDAQGALTDYGSQLQNKALMDSYNQQLGGLQGLAGLGNNTNAIAGQMSNMGNIQGQGTIGAAQTDIASQNQIFSDITGMASMALTGGNVGGFSDPRLKDNIEYVGESNGYPLFKWAWNELAEGLGLKGESQGVMATDVAKRHPAAIGEREGYMTVNYEMIGVPQ